MVQTGHMPDILSRRAMPKSLPAGFEVVITTSIVRVWGELIGKASGRIHRIVTAEESATRHGDGYQTAG